MKTGIWIFLALVLIAVAIISIATKSKPRGKKGSFSARPIATANEQHMFWKLTKAFPAPEYVVLAQVSFGALLTAKGGASRYSFSQKMADFVLTDKAFTVLAVIELDDSSHKGREDNDKSRDAMLIEAGYKVVRYPRIPEVDKLQADMKGKA